MSISNKKRKRETKAINEVDDEIRITPIENATATPPKEIGFNEQIMSPLKKLKNAFTNYISPSKTEKNVQNNSEIRKEPNLITSTPRRKKKPTASKSSDSPNQSDKLDSENLVTIQISEESKDTSESNVFRTIFSPLLKVGKTIQNFAQGSDESDSESEDIIEEIESILKESDRSCTESDQEDEYVEEEFDSFTFIASLPSPENLPSPLITNILPKKIHEQRKKTLVLDLDETLVHCSLEKIDNPDLVFTVPFFSEEFEVYVRKRPHFEHFLKTLSKKFEIAIFTASQQAYADKLLNILDPKKEWIHHRIFRDNCTLVLGNYLKDLSILGRDLSKVVIVDNSPHVFAYQIDNGIPIESWFDDDKDEELLKLIPFLESLLEAEDVRPKIREKFALFQIVEERRKTNDILFSP